MSGSRSLLTRGKGPIALLTTAVVTTFVAGLFRRHLVTALTGVLVSVPLVPFRRLLLGAVIDLPAVVLTIVVCAAAKRFVAGVDERPWVLALGLTCLVWLVDLALALLIADILVLWTDGFVLAPRLGAAAAAAVGSAVVLGWRPRRSKGQAPSEDRSDC